VHLVGFTIEMSKETVTQFPMGRNNCCNGSNLLVQQERQSFQGLRRSDVNCSLSSKSNFFLVVFNIHVFLAVRAQHNMHSTAQYSTVQYSTAQHSTAQYSTAQHSTVQHSTVQHSTVQHSTAQHSTVQHSTAQHSTALFVHFIYTKEQK